MVIHNGSVGLEGGYQSPWMLSESSHIRHGQCELLLLYGSYYTLGVYPMHTKCSTIKKTHILQREVLFEHIVHWTHKQKADLSLL